MQPNRFCQFPNKFTLEFRKDGKMPKILEYEAECQGCDMFMPVNDLGSCEDFAGKIDWDMIRKRDWAYSVLAFDSNTLTCPILLYNVAK
jgi:hypothetical protein